MTGEDVKNESEGTAPDQEKAKKITGVFSTQEVRKVGTGTTTRKVVHKTLWYAEESADGQIEVTPLNSNYVPSGAKKKLSLDEFLDSYAPEPEMYVSTVYPKMRALAKQVALADRHRDRGELYSAEMEYSGALKVDEENVRANFGLGLTYLARGETNKADNIFERLVKLEATFAKEHKHLFNEFGINLRKNGMADHAIVYYGKALELAKNDGHLCYNLARAYLEKKDYDKALSWVLQSLRLSPELEVAMRFLVWLVSHGHVPEHRKEEVATVIQSVKEASASAPTEARQVPAVQDKGSTGLENTGQVKE